MAEDSGQEKTEAASSKRLEDARKKGQVPRSRELTTLASLLGSGLAMLMLGPDLISGLEQLLIDSLSFDQARAFDSYSISTQLDAAVKAVMVLLAPIFLLMCGITILSPVALGGFLFAGSHLLPKFERIDPMKGLARIFSVKGLLELIKSIIKVVLVAGTVLLVFSFVLQDIINLPLQELGMSISQSGSLLVKCFLAFSVVLIVVVIIDVPFQLWDHKRQMMMTRQEVREEMKESDGRPEVKQAIRARQQEISQRRMMQAVPQADVIITNPTHFAVAIRYDQHGKGAPVVVAKGKDLVAAKIREIAREHKVAIFSAPPLARALYAATDLNKEIPENLFTAVAQVLAYIFQLQQAPISGHVIPQAPTNISVPDEYTRKEQAQ